MGHNDIRREAEAFLDQLEFRYGHAATMRRRLLPITVRILETGPPSARRRDLMRLVVRAYAHHTRVCRTIDTLRVKLRQHLNQVYGEVLGIEPPGNV